MNEKEAIEYLEDWYLKVPDNKEVHCGVKNHNEVMDTAIAALKEVQEYHATGRTPGMVRALQVAYTEQKSDWMNISLLEYRSSAGKLWSVPGGFR